MNQAFAPIVSWAERHAAQLRLGARTVVAGTITFLLAHLFNLAQGYWAVFTAVIVTQMTVGGSLKASVDRLIGTIGGAVYGGAIIYLAAPADPISKAVALAVALGPLAVLAALDDRFRVAPVTAVIMLLVPTAPTIGPVSFTIDRILEIALGGAVAVVVSLFVLPARAHGVLGVAAGRMLALLADLLPMLIGALEGSDRRGDIIRLQDQTRHAAARLEAATAEARRERETHLTSDPDPEPILRTSLRLRNDLIMIGRAAAEPLDPAIQARLGPTLGKVTTSATTFLNAIAAAFTERSAPPPLDAFEASLRVYGEEIAALRREGLTRSLSGEAVGRLFALGFAFEQLNKDMRDLANRCAEFAKVGRRTGAPMNAAP